MKVALEEVLFVSDVLRELDPAHEAGCQTRLSVRAGNQPVDQPHEHKAIASFEEIA
jgi:methionine salvage enolase-phosphatase E1